MDRSPVLARVCLVAADGKCQASLGESGDLEESQRLKEEALEVLLELNAIVEQYKFCRELFSKLMNGL